MASNKSVNIENFIEVVRLKPCLYDTTLPEYKNTHVKKRVWQEIANQVGGKNGETMSWKWKNLRDSYAKYKKYRLSPNNETAQKFTNWCWAPYMTFLDPFLRKPKDYIAFDDTEEANSPDTNSSISEMPIEVNPDMDSSSPVVYSFSGTYNDNNKKRKYDIEEVYEPQSFQQNDKIDKIDGLFLSYADTFKKLSPRRRAILKLEMAKLFAEAELDEINSDPIKFEN